ncbi:MAG: hypothetical protein LBR51_02200 [Bacteroidales bacterium]|jgi:hypothetical protein|nr:hypothetical protein [Bacteroidales bacterium]
MGRKEKLLQEYKERLAFLQSKGETLSSEERAETESLQQRLKELNIEQEVERMKDIIGKTVIGVDPEKYDEYNKNR